jgi:hypothetical protein
VHTARAERGFYAFGAFGDVLGMIVPFLFTAFIFGVLLLLLTMMFWSGPMLLFITPMSESGKENFKQELLSVLPKLLVNLVLWVVLWTEYTSREPSHVFTRFSPSREAASCNWSSCNRDCLERRAVPTRRHLPTPGDVEQLPGQGYRETDQQDAGDRQREGGPQEESEELRHFAEPRLAQPRFAVTVMPSMNGTSPPGAGHSATTTAVSAPADNSDLVSTPATPATTRNSAINAGLPAIASRRFILHLPFPGLFQVALLCGRHAIRTNAMFDVGLRKTRRLEGCESSKGLSPSSGFFKARSSRMPAFRRRVAVPRGQSSSRHNARRARPRVR